MSRPVAPRRVRAAGARVEHRFGSRDDGDLAVGLGDDVLAPRRAAIAPGEWTWLRQVHGAVVVTVDRPGDGAGTEADGAVTATPGAVLAVHTADCVPVLFADRDAAVIGAAHAGWRGTVAGVLDATIEAMVALGASTIEAHIGPHIRAGCYEFGAEDLDAVVAACGSEARGRTAQGQPALDLTAAVLARLGSLGLDASDSGTCTACDPGYYSHRARADIGRQASTIVLRDR